MKNLTRTALLINAQSPGTSYLPGASQDSSSIHAYLKSPVGGAFYENEIHILTNPTCEEVLAAVQMVNTDYLYVHVSSHGYTAQNGQRMICLRNGHISDLQLLNNSRWQLVMVDACRNFQKGKAIGGIQWPEENVFNFTGGSWARSFFDNALLSLPGGQMIVHATQFGLFAYEDVQRIGGQFTLSFLDTMVKWQNSGQEGYITIDQALQDVAHLLYYKENPQYPQIVYRTTNHSLPVGIVSPRFIEEVLQHKAPTMQENNSMELVALASLLLVVGIALSK